MRFPKPRKRATALTWVTDHLAVGGAPLSVEQLDRLKHEGVDAILNLCGEFCDLHHVEAAHGFEVRYMPIGDEEAPELHALEETLAWLDECLYLGKKTYIHCRHGIGRTGTVLNAYLLRRGLGHRGAARILKHLRSQPTNFEQWWTVRKYGRTSPRLTIREPSLENGRLVDLGPFFRDYEAIAGRADDLYHGPGPRCGRDHDRCGGVPVRLTLAEAVCLRHAIDSKLSSQDRAQAIDRAVASARKERALSGLCATDDEACCLFDAGAVCPLQGPDGCIVFAHRPLQCRTYDLPGDMQRELWDDVLAPALTRLSEEILFAFTNEPTTDTLPAFSLPDVISGRYVQAFFHFLLKR
ncbi:MAG: dual specificity protein phosphatase family protein [Desulfovibrionaceae bacterium]